MVFLCEKLLKRIQITLLAIGICLAAQITKADDDQPAAADQQADQRAEVATPATDDNVASEPAVPATDAAQPANDNSASASPLTSADAATPATETSAVANSAAPASAQLASSATTATSAVPATTTAPAAASTPAQLAPVVATVPVDLPPPAADPASPAPSSAQANQTSQPLVWLDDYSQAMSQAKAEHKLMLIHFFRASDQKRAEAATAGDSVVNVEKAFNQPALRAKLAGFVLTKLPIDSQVTIKGDNIRLLNHGAFSELHKGAGLAVIDFAHPKAEYFGYVVSVLPFTPGKYYRFRSSQVQTLVELPEGTLTQRSMIFAVRIHPEHPASTVGQENPVLLSEAASHSDYQAQVHVQGHQGWGSRFERIIGKLLGRGEPGTPVEVVAESWPDQDLMDSCVDCVASWRQSPGHWEAVSAKQASYGYDIREGTNGIWYATGIFREAH